MATRAGYRTSARNRRAMDPSVPKKLTPAIITQIDATAADTIQLTFGSRVLPRAVPGFTAGAGGAETVATMTPVSNTVIELVFTGDVQGSSMNVQEGDGGIRTPAGGFVPAGVYAIPTFP